MENTISMEMTPDEAAQLSAVIERCLKFLDESNERSERMFAEIAQLRAETRAMLRQIGAILNVETNL